MSVLFDASGELTQEQRGKLLDALTKGITRGYKLMPIEELFAWASAAMSDYFMLQWIMKGYVCIGKNTEGKITFGLTDEGRMALSEDLHIPDAFRDAWKE